MDDNRPLWRRRLVEHANLLCSRDTLHENVIGPMILNLLDVIDGLEESDRAKAYEAMARFSPMPTNIDSNAGVVIMTVEEFRRRLASLPGDLRVIGYYNGANDDVPVSVFVNDFKGVDDGTNPPPALVVSLD